MLCLVVSNAKNRQLCLTSWACQEPKYPRNAPSLHQLSIHWESSRRQCWLLPAGGVGGSDGRRAAKGGPVGTASEQRRAAATQPAAAARGAHWKSCFHVVGFVAEATQNVQTPSGCGGSIAAVAIDVVVTRFLACLSGRVTEERKARISGC